LKCSFCLTGLFSTYEEVNKYERPINEELQKITNINQAVYLVKGNVSRKIKH